MVFRTLPCLLFSLVSLIEQRCQNPVLSGTDFAILLISYLFANGLGYIASARFYRARRKQYEVQTRALELRKDLIQNALLDELTGVANRRHFYQSAESEFERFQRYKRPLSVLMLDLDHFKNVNDQFGHPAGDKVLKDFSAIVGRCKRDIDLFGRLGGEEFALLLPETGLSEATDIAVRLRRACHGVGIPGAADRRITISIGATQAHLDDANFDEVLARADAALYRAKNSGRDRVEVD
jgi:two-component system, cell cycle response regulator